MADTMGARLRRSLSVIVLAVALGSVCSYAAAQSRPSPATQSPAADAQGLPLDGAVPQQIQPRPETAIVLAPEIRDTLSRYGSFVTDDTYGEIWMPTVTPTGWHPYPPCHWVKAKRWGLYYDDQTEWGRIVHHFGRWIHDKSRGWMWVAGGEFSPGWVVWRSSRAWTGWAPLPPTNDEMQAADAMAGADSWLFQETPILLAGCRAEQIATPARISTLLVDTPYVTRVGFWNDMAVFIVPPWIAGPFFQVDLSFKPWPHWFIATVAAQWNFVWHHTTISTVKNVCLKPKGI